MIKLLFELPCPSQLQYGSPTCNFWPRVSPCDPGAPRPPGQAPAPCSPSLLRMRRLGPSPGIRGLESRGLGTARGHHLGNDSNKMCPLMCQIERSYIWRHPICLPETNTQYNDQRFWSLQTWKLRWCVEGSWKLFKNIVFLFWVGLCKTSVVRNDREIKIARWSGCESVLRCCRINSLHAILTRFLLNRYEIKMKKNCTP